MRTIDELVIHCSASKNGNPEKFTAMDVDMWHRERGWKRDPAAMKAFNPQFRAIGYHFLIFPDGHLETGRSPDEQGCHCPPNEHNLGVMLFGTDKFSLPAWEQLKNLALVCRSDYKGINITGHYQHQSAIVQNKKCPCFDVPEWVASGFTPNENHIWVPK